MSRLLTLRRNLSRLLARDEVDDNFVNVASDFTGTADPAALVGAYVQPYMKWADTGSGWLKRRNAANDGWVAEQRLLRQSMPLYQIDELPTTNIGAIYVNGQGAAEWDSGSGSYTPRMLLRSDKGAASGIAPLDVVRRLPELNSRYPGVQGSTDGADFNTYLVSDDYYIRAPGPNAPSGFTGQGMLRVRTYSNMTFHELIQWDSTTGRWWRMKLSSAGDFGPWRRVVAEGGALRRIRITDPATNANTLTADNAFYVWSNANVMGANFPNITGAGYLLPVILSDDTMSQELHVVAGNRKPWIFQRFLPTSGVWQPWKVVGPVSSAATMPNWDAGDIYVDGAGWYRWNGTAYALAATGSGIPAGSVAWWPLRTSIPAGQIPADGQTVSRATFPDLAAMVTGGKVPVVTEADWLADPLKRGSYTPGDGTTTIRVPDLNGQASGSLGAVFRRGDGALSSGANGLIQRDALQQMTGLVGNMLGLPGTSDPGAGTLRKVASVNSGTGGTSATLQLSNIEFTASLSARTATETRPLNVSGVWTIQAFGAVTNPGSADAAQLASDYARLSAAFQTNFGFVVLYPGGSAEAPGILSANTRAVVANPFPGYAIMVVAEHRVGSPGAYVWGEPGWYSAAYASTGESAWGIRAGHILSTDNIIVQSGKNGTATAGSLSGGTLAETANQTNAYYRLKVWKLGVTL